MPKEDQLPLSCLPAVFGVSAVSIYLWRQGTPTKDPLVEPFTATRLRRWAKKNGRPIVAQPETVLLLRRRADQAALRKAAKPARGLVKQTGTGGKTSSRPNPKRAGSRA